MLNMKKFQRHLRHHYYHLLHYQQRQLRHHHHYPVMRKFLQHNLLLVSNHLRYQNLLLGLLHTNLYHHHPNHQNRQR
jgi:hypothetical protein